ncbi:hypothetical protein [Ferrimonas marina]|uniref:hypothetical protein n=1 Tax=Ferrimonas marina TaxID=299255 RepID=UPI00082C2A6C|nr:hypothetical protein [Ferrimonas marina]
MLLLLAPLAAAECNLTDVELTDAELSQQMTLSFKAFDQTPDQGWRRYYDRGCYSQAAQLLVAYVETHPERAERYTILLMHTGQLLAMSGEDDAALPYLRRQRALEQGKDNPYWDNAAFTDAHIAFLQRDKAALIAARDRIAKKQPIPDTSDWPDWMRGKIANLDVVEGFLHCFDRPFAEAYGQDCRQGLTPLTDIDL